MGEALARRLAQVAGAFALWAVGRAMRDGVERLYFLSRDGWAPFQAARRLCRGWALPLECRYLYGSRYAWRLALAHRDEAGALSQLLGRGLSRRGEDVLRRAGLEDAAAGLLGEMGRGPRELLTRQDLECPRFRFLWRVRSRRALPGLLAYLERAGLGQAVPWALVDSGWMGSTQEALAQALAGARRPRGYYWGLYRAPQAGDWACYSFAPGRGLAGMGWFCPALLEAALACLQGTVTGYTEAGEPLLAPAPPAGPFALQRERALAAWASQLAGRPRPRDPLALALALRPQANGILRRVTVCPTREEAALLGALPFSGEPAAGGAATLAQSWPALLPQRVLARARSQGRTLALAVQAERRHLWNK